MFPDVLVQTYFQASFMSKLYCQSLSTYEQCGRRVKQVIPSTGCPDSSVVGIGEVELVQQCPILDLVPCSPVLLVQCGHCSFLLSMPHAWQLIVFHAMTSCLKFRQATFSYDAFIMI